MTVANLRAPVADITVRKNGRQYEALHIEFDHANGVVHATARRFVVTGPDWDRYRSYAGPPTWMTWPLRSVDVSYAPGVTPKAVAA